MFSSRIIDTMHPLSQALRIRCCKYYASADAGGIHPLIQEGSPIPHSSFKDSIKVVINNKHLKVY